MDDHARREVSDSRALARSQEARAALTWVSDDGLGSLDESNPWAAGALSFVFPGAGQMYVRDFKTGGALLLVWAVLVFGAFPYLGDVAGWSLVALMFGAGGYGALQAHRINRYMATFGGKIAAGGSNARVMSLVNAHNQAMGVPAPNVAKGLAHAPAPASPVGPPPDATDPVERLRKLYVLHMRGMVDGGDFASRKIDLLQDLVDQAPTPEDALYRLLPLRDEGIVDEDDIELARSLAV